MEPFICNVVPSKATDDDWLFSDSIISGALGVVAAIPRSVDLRAPWWPINNQRAPDRASGERRPTVWCIITWSSPAGSRRTSFCHPQHVRMASNEADVITSRPETFIERAGTTLKAAVDVARMHGVALMADLPFQLQTNMYLREENAFYASCAQRRVNAYFNLRKNLTNWKEWLASNSPLLAASTRWDNAANTGGKVDAFRARTVRADMQSA